MLSENLYCDQAERRIDAILKADRTAPVQRRHATNRTFERLRDEHGSGGGYTMVKDHVGLWRVRGCETFVLWHTRRAMRRWFLTRRSA